jgi:ABC-type branched-subunit amino acid transport system substrate-binding protein
VSRRVDRGRALVPGEGIEPSRAEAHGFLRPARLPIPPSRPRVPSVAAIARRTGLAAAVAVAVGACGFSPAAPEGPRIAFIFDGISDEADEVSGPALAGLRFAVIGTGDPETVVPVNLGPDPEEAARQVEATVADPSVVAAVVAPWTDPPPGIEARIAEGKIPVVSLSWGWVAPAASPAMSLAVDRTAEAELLLAAGATQAAPGSPLCLAGDGHPMSRPLADAVVVAAGPDAGLRRVGTVDPDRPATASDVASGLSSAGCDTVLWTGGVAALELLLDAAPSPGTVVGTSRIKTSGGIEVGMAHPARRLVATCACADITLTREPELQRFIHDYQTEAAGAPGVHAVEAYDAGRLLFGIATEVGGREAVGDRLAATHSFDGLLGAYRIGDDGSLEAGPAPAGWWRASGSRWLPVGTAGLAAVLSALPLAAVLPIVAPGSVRIRRGSIDRSRGDDEARTRTRRAVPGRADAGRRGLRRGAGPTGRRGQRRRRRGHGLRPARSERRRPARQDLRGGRDPGLDRPRVPAPVGAEPGDR